MPHHFTKIAIVGATGQVGRVLLQIMAEEQFPAEKIMLVASQKSAGRQIEYQGQMLTIQALDQFDFSQVQCAFFAAGSDVAKQYAPIAAEAGCYVIDKSSYYRMDPTVPLVVPEVNGDMLQTNKSKIIAVPNCSTIPLVMALKPLQDMFGLERVDVATYQAVSGAGVQGVEELKSQVDAYAKGEAQPEPKKFIAPIAFNVVPMIDSLLSTGYTKEEMKMHEESRKILMNDSLIVNATAVRVPVWVGHSEAVNVKTIEKVDFGKLIKRWQENCIHISQSDMPTPVSHAAGNNNVWLGRIRRHPSEAENHVSFWLTCDNLRKGAAYNAWQVAKMVQKNANLF